MSKRHAIRLALPAALLAALLTLLSHPAPAAQTLTEHTWMVALVDSLGRSFGLPDEPKVEDYLTILSGKRNLRYEAEDVRAEGRASTLAFRNFGPFSGSGWVLGTSQPSRIALRFVLPLSGRYRLNVAVGRAGHVIQVGDRQFTADGDERQFRLVELGEIDLLAGPQEVFVTLPPGGAIDYLDLTAANLPPIAPEGGWQADRPLTWEVLTLTALQALDLAGALPASARSVSIEAETLRDTGGAQVVTDAHLGQPSGGRWLRTVMQPAVITVPLDIPQSGFYDLELTALGERLDIEIAGHLQINVTGQPYLAPVNLPPCFLPKGPARLVLTVPPGGGFDRLVLKARQSDLPAMAAALGVTVSGAAPGSAELDRLAARISNPNR